MYRQKYNTTTFFAASKIVALHAGLKMLKKFRRAQETSDDQDVEEETTSVHSEDPVDNYDYTLEAQETSDDQDVEEETTSVQSADPGDVYDDLEVSSNDGNPSTEEDEDYSRWDCHYQTEADEAVKELIEEYSEKLSGMNVKKEDIRAFVKKCVDLLKQCLKEDNMARIAELLEILEKLDDEEHEDYLAIAGKAMACNSYASVLLEIIEKKESINDQEALLGAVDKAWGLIICYADRVKKMSSALAEEPIVEIMKRRLEDKQARNKEEVDEESVHDGSEDDNDNEDEESVDKEDCNNELVLLYLMARDGRLKEEFREHKIVELVTPFLEDDDKFTKAYAFLIITHIAEEQEIKGIIDKNTGMIKTCLGWVQKDLDEEGAGHHGLGPWEIALGMAKIAAIDANEKTSVALLLCKQNAVGILYELLGKEDAKSQAAAALLLWNLAFDKAVRKTMNNYLDLPDRLQCLQRSSDKKVKDNVAGALWMMASTDLASGAAKRAKSARRPTYDIFISYCWEQQKLVKQLHKYLKTKNYKIWFDLNEMSGSTLDAMAGAVETSSLVLICVSEKYKQSTNCRTEAEYTYNLRKERIPVLVQTKYKADGWLGALMGTTLYFDVDADFTGAAENLCKEIEKKLASRSS